MLLYLNTFFKFIVTIILIYRLWIVHLQWRDLARSGMPVSKYVLNRKKEGILTDLQTAWWRKWHTEIETTDVWTSNHPLLTVNCDIHSKIHIALVAIHAVCIWPMQQFEICLEKFTPQRSKAVTDELLWQHEFITNRVQMLLSVYSYWSFALVFSSIYKNISIISVYCIFFGLYDF